MYDYWYFCPKQVGHSVVCSFSPPSVGPISWPAATERLLSEVALCTLSLTDMGALDLFVQSLSSATLLAALVVLLVVYVVSSLGSKKDRNGPPGPKALPLLGNLLQLDLKRPYYSLLEVRYCLLGFIYLLSLCRSDRKMPPTTKGMSIFGMPATKLRSRVNDTKGWTSEWSSGLFSCTTAQIYQITDETKWICHMMATVSLRNVQQ